MAIQENKKILIVEDNPEIREGLADLLKLEGFSVDTAESGQSALNLLLSDLEKPNYIILDVFMPGMSGIEFRKKQQAIPALAKIPTIVLTCADTDPKMRDSLSAAAYLQKPTEIQQILDCIEQCKGS